MADKNIQLKDKDGNLLYPKTKSEIVDVTYVELTGETGTLTADELTLLQKSKLNVIRLKVNVGTTTTPIYVYEIFRYEDEKTNSGYIAYTHIEKETTNNTVIKVISIILGSRSWTLKTQIVPSVQTEEEELGKVLTQIKISTTGIISSTKDIALDVLRKSKVTDENQAVAFHNAIPGGRDITSYFNDSADWADGKPQIWKRIQSGTFSRSAAYITAHPNDPTSVTFTLFEGLFPGDYWKMTEKIRSRQDDNGTAQTNEGTDYVMIGGFDLLWGNGDDNASVENVNYHHIVCVPGKPGNYQNTFGQHRMNATDDTTGGYYSSVMRTNVIGSVTSVGKRFSAYPTATINQQLYAEFGAHLATTREFISNAMTSTGISANGLAQGSATGRTWVSAQAQLMSENEVYGCHCWASGTAENMSTMKQQMPLFRLFPIAINNRYSWYWLSDVATASIFCLVNHSGNAGAYGASGSDGFVRPRFVLKA